jgi:lysophospholipase L1-like esterase
MKKTFVSLILLYLFLQFTAAQDPRRFQVEIDSLKKIRIERESNTKTILFAGSSSFRMWGDIQSYFPGNKIINTGFGGSHMSDLLFYLDDVVIQYKPDLVFIYEGDNDVASGKKPSEIMKDTKELVHRLNKSLPSVPLIFISPKPSLARWELRETYMKLNERFERYAARHEKVDFINVWPLMLNQEGTPVKELFIEDGLHMSKEGYDIWAREIVKYF